MNVLNIHQRRLSGRPEPVGRLLDALASEDDPLWPHRSWPRMRFDRPLEVGASGGHGPIRYDIEAYDPGRSIRFRFTAPAGFNGYHGLEVLPRPEGGSILRHTVNMKTSWPATWTWPLVYRPLHDALSEDALGRAQQALGEPPDLRPWSAYVRLLRWILQGRPVR